MLLGQDNGKTINVANSFGIPFEEDEKDSKTWFLDHNYIEGMYEMFKKVNGMSSNPAQQFSNMLMIFINLYSTGTDDWVVSYGAEVEGIRPGDK